MTLATNTNRHHRVVIAGGGTAGLSVAATLLRQSPQLDVAVIDPSDAHHYQPGWTLVGGGDMRAEDTRRRQADLMPNKATWLKETVGGFSPDHNAAALASGERVTYDFLVVALGLQIGRDAIEGLPETLGKNGATSNYRYDLAPYTQKLAESLQGGDALFTQFQA